MTRCCRSRPESPCLPCRQVEMNFFERNSFRVNDQSGMHFFAVMNLVDLFLSIQQHATTTFIVKGGEMLHPDDDRSEEHTSELQSLMRISYAVFCLKKKKKTTTSYNMYQHTVKI